MACSKVLAFGPLMAEHDRCVNKAYVSSDYILRCAKISNTNRTYDHVSAELERAIASGAKFEKIATIIGLRMASSPRQSEKEGAGAAPLMAAARLGLAALQAHVAAMPFSSRKTYRSAMRKELLALALPFVAFKLAQRKESWSLYSLQQRIIRYFKQFQWRALHFHSLQIAMDLMVYDVLPIKNKDDCPVTIGSRRGLARVRKTEGKEKTLKRLAVETGREPHEVQTSLCEYDKYCRYHEEGIPAGKRRRLA